MNPVNTFGRRAALIAIALSVAVLWAVPASAQAFKWWQSERFKKELGLTQDQSTRIEDVFQHTLPGLRKQKESLDKAEADFNQMVETSDDAQVMAQVTVDIGGQTVVAAVTRGGVEQLGVAAGDDVTVLIKATEVMLGK